MLNRRRAIEKVLDSGLIFARGVKSSGRKKGSKLPVLLSKVSWDQLDGHSSVLGVQD